MQSNYSRAGAIRIFRSVGGALKSGQQVFDLLPGLSYPPVYKIEELNRICFSE